MYTTLDECYQCEGVAKAAQTGIVGFDRRFKLQRIYEANDCNLMSEKEGGLTIPNVAELVVTVLFGAVVGEACTFLDQNAITRGHEGNWKEHPDKIKQ